MTQALDSFLSRLASDYGKNDAKPDNAAMVQATIAVVKASKPRTMPETKVEPRLTFPVPAMGSLDAKGFLQAMKDAGMRWTEQGKPIFQPFEVRDDQIKAIAAFIGYDPKDHFGSQELRARMKAHRVLFPFASGDRKIPLSIKGYAIGMPDPIGKKRADLEGRERMAVEAIGNHEKQANEAITDEDRDYHLSFALLERERLSVIRQDLDSLLQNLLTHRPFGYVQ
jgi:hypothetical protein